LLAAAIAATLVAARPASVHAQLLAPGIPAEGTPPSAPADDRAGLSPDVFYRLLLGDVALQRGETSLAARAYYEAAREARDPRIAKRASEVALAARMRGLAQESAKLWATLDPMAERPKQILAALAAGSNGKAPSEGGVDNDLKIRLEKVIADAAITDRGPGEIFLQQPVFRRYARQAPDPRARARTGEAVSEESGSALRGSARRV
jgi:hypothetical protein